MGFDREELLWFWLVLEDVLTFFVRFVEIIEESHLVCIYLVFYEVLIYLEC